MDLLEHQIRRNVLLGLIAELYGKNLSDVIAVKEWLESKLDEPAENEPRCTNHYLCQSDGTRWDAGWSCMCNDRCPTCDAVVEPYATTATRTSAKRFITKRSMTGRTWWGGEGRKEQSVSFLRSFRCMASWLAGQYGLGSNAGQPEHYA